MTIRTDIRAALAARVKACVPELREVYPSRPVDVVAEDLPLAFCYFLEGGDGEFSLDWESEQDPFTGAGPADGLPLCGRNQ